MNNNIKSNNVIDYGNKMKKKLIKQLRGRGDCFNSYNNCDRRHLYESFLSYPVSVNGIIKNNFIGFYKRIDMIDFLQKNKYYNFLEVINTNDTRIYFDLDFKKDDNGNKLSCDIGEVMEIVNYIRNRIRKYFTYNENVPQLIRNISGKLANESDAYVYVKKDKNNQVNSIHIIFDIFYTNKENIKKIINFDTELTQSLLEKYNIILDDKIYSGQDKIQQFYLPYQTKLGSNNFFEPVNDDDKYKNYNDIEKTLISHIKDLHKLELDDNMIEEPQNYIINETETETKSKSNSKSKKKKTIKNFKHNKPVKYLNPDNYVDTLIKLLPDKFYTQNIRVKGKAIKIWTKISRQIYIHKLKDYEKWGTHSEKKGGYNDGSNRIWSENLNENFISYKFQDYLDILNDNYDLEYNLIWSIHNFFTNEIRDWLSSKIKISKTDLDDLIDECNEINKNRKKKHNEISYDVFKYNFINGLLYDTSKNKTYSSAYELKYNNQYGVEDIKFNTIKQDDISSKVINFLKSKNKIFVGKMLWGSGKTHFGVKTALKHAVKHNMRTLILTENNALNRAYYNQIKELGYNVGYHQPQNQKKDDIDKFDIWITSLQSLIKTTQNIRDFPLIIGDEIESILSVFSSEATFEKGFSITDTINYINHIFRNANKIICLDCDISKRTIDILKDNISEAIILYNCDFNNWSDYTYNFYIDKAIFKDDFINDIKLGKKIVYSTLAKANSEDIFTDLQILNLNKNILLITGQTETKLIINGELFDTSKKKQIKAEHTNISSQLENAKKNNMNDTDYLNGLSKKLDILNEKLEIAKYVCKANVFNEYENVVERLKIDIVIHTPTIKTGISFNIQYFDKVYAYACYKSCVGREFLQMIHRQRILKDKEINIYTNCNFTNTTQLISSDITKAFLDYNKDRRANKLINKFMNSIEMRLWNEIDNSNYNLTQDIIGRLKYNHNLNIDFIGYPKSNSIIVDGEVMEEGENETIREREYKLIKTFDIITDTEFKELNEIQDKTDEENLHIYKQISMNRININDDYNYDITRLFLPLNFYLHSNQSSFTSGVFTNYIQIDDDFDYLRGNEWGRHKDIQTTNADKLGRADRRKYDKRHLIKYSDGVANITQNKEYHNWDMFDLVCDNDDEINEFITKEALKHNQSDIVNMILHILHIDMKNLKYKRFILTNERLKHILDDNKDWIRKVLNDYLIHHNREDRKYKHTDLSHYISSNNKQYSSVKHQIGILLDLLLIKMKYRTNDNKNTKHTNDDKNLVIFEYDNKIIRTNYRTRLFDIKEHFEKVKYDKLSIEAKKNVLSNDFYKQPEIYNIQKKDVLKSSNRKVNYKPITLILRLNYNYNFKSTYDIPKTKQDDIDNKVKIIEGDITADYGNLKVVKYNKKNWVNNYGIYEVEDNEYFTTNHNMELLNDRNNKIDSKIKKVKNCESIAEEVASDFINKIFHNLFISRHLNTHKYNTAHQTFFDFYKLNPSNREDKEKCKKDYDTKKEYYYKNEKDIDFEDEPEMI